MNELSKARIKIKEINHSYTYINPVKMERDREALQFKADLWMVDQTIEQIKRNIDVVTIDVELLDSDKKGELMIHIKGQTVYEIRHFTCDEVSEELWVYLVSTAFRHLTAQFIYKEKKRLPQNYMMPVVVFGDEIDIRNNINNLWRNE